MINIRDQGGRSTSVGHSTAYAMALHPCSVCAAEGSLRTGTNSCKGCKHFTEVISWPSER